MELGCELEVGDALGWSLREKVPDGDQLGNVLDGLVDDSLGLVAGPSLVKHWVSQWDLHSAIPLGPNLVSHWEIQLVETVVQSLEACWRGIPSFNTKCVTEDESLNGLIANRKFDVVCVSLICSTCCGYHAVHPVWDPISPPGRCGQCSKKEDHRWFCHRWRVSRPLMVVAID